jgi:hypothetical protein
VVVQDSVGATASNRTTVLVADGELLVNATLHALIAICSARGTSRTEYAANASTLGGEPP